MLLDPDTFWIDHLRSTRAIVARGKGALKLHVSGNYIWTRVWKNVLGTNWEMRLWVYSLAVADSKRLARI
jgi:hypothetical protein